MACLHWYFSLTRISCLSPQRRWCTNILWKLFPPSTWQLMERWVQKLIFYIRSLKFFFRSKPTRKWSGSLFIYSFQMSQSLPKISHLVSSLIVCGTRRHWCGIPSHQPKTVFLSSFCFSGGENKPVLSHQAWESGQRANRGPGAAGRLCFIWAVTHDG